MARWIALAAAAPLIGGGFTPAGGRVWGGEVYRVGPAREWQSLAAVADRLQPGDTVEVDGGFVYAGAVTFGRPGEPERPIAVRGVARDGRWPVLVPGPADVGAVVRFDGDHYLFSGFEITAGGNGRLMRGLYNVADDVTVRDTLVRDCPFNGVTGSDRSGSFTMERVEVRGCGDGLKAHQIYVGTDNARFPRAVFRMRSCRVRDGKGGNNIKSRAGRTELYYNLIEGAAFHELDLVGADPAGQAAGTAAAVREDADVVGNLLIKRPTSRGGVARLGSDGTGESRGRYRFAFNTVIVAGEGEGGDGRRERRRATPVFLLRGPIESIEVANNVFAGAGGGKMELVARQYSGKTGASMSGWHNWIAPGTAGIPGAWRQTATGDDPRLGAEGSGDYAPGPGSPLREAAVVEVPPEFSGVAAVAGRVPDLLVCPEREPPIPGGGWGGRRPTVGAPDIGAFEGR